MSIKSNSLKRKAYFEDAYTNKHKFTSYTNIDEDEQDSVTLELDVTLRAPLLKKMYKPIISNYIKYYDNKELRHILIEKPQISIQLLGESLVEYVVPLLSDEEFHYFMRRCAQDLKNIGIKLESLEQIKKIAKSDEIVMKLLKIISNNFEKYVTCDRFYRKNFDTDDFKHLTKEVIMKCVKRKGKILKYLSLDLRSDREIVLEAVKSNGKSLKYASNWLQSDEEIVKAAITENGSALDFASDELKSKKSLKLLALKKLNHNILKCIIQDTDREVILQAVKSYPFVFTQVRTEFKSDREIVFAAVQKKGCLLKYASRELQLDRELVLLSIQNCTCKESRIPSELYSDKEIVLAGISQKLITFVNIPKELQRDKEVVLSALKNGSSFKEIPKEMFNDSDIVLEIVKKENQYTIYNFLKEINVNEKDWILEFIK